MHTPSAKAVRANPKLVELLSSLPTSDVIAVVVFGSVARAEQDESSDLDVLIVVDDDLDRRAFLTATRELAVTPLVLSEQGVLNEARVRPSFVMHLLQEGALVHASDRWPAVREALEARSEDPGALTREIQARLRHVRQFRNLKGFEHTPITALSHLYAIGRSVVIARLLQEGVHEFSWRRAFDAYEQLHPELRSDLESLKALRPYYEFARARTTTPPKGQLDLTQAQAVVRSIEQLAA